MTTNLPVTRRGVLAVGVAGAGAAVLSACGSSSNSANSKAASTAAKAETTAGSSGASSPSGSGSGADALATLADIPIGGAVSVKLPGGKPGIVGRPASATAICFSAICTHEGCTVAPAGKLLECPCHHSRFDATTGAVISGLAPSPLNRIAVTVTDGKVVTA